MGKPNIHETVSPEIAVEAASVEYEVARVQHYISVFDSVSKHTQSIVFPKGLDIQNYSDLNQAEEATREEYDPNYYLEALDKVKSSLPTIQAALEVLRQFQESWGFELDSSYRIVLTRYGTGGSYHLDTGEIVMRTTREGDFARPNPAATPIHELTHMCVEHLVKQYALSFSEKEDLVNGIGKTLFPEIFDPTNVVPEDTLRTRREMLTRLPDIIKDRRLKIV